MIKRNMYYDMLAHIDSDDILLLIWARQVWKTTILKQLREEIAGESYFMTCEDPLVRNICNTHPEWIFDITLSQPTVPQTIFIDEIQYLDDPSHFLKYLYDVYAWVIKLVVTWSSSFYIDQRFGDSLAWRKRVFHLQTLHFTEFLRFKEEDAIVTYMKKNKRIPETYRHKVYRYLKEYMLYWWYPKIVLINDLEEKQLLLRQYAYDLIKKDFYDLHIRYDDAFLWLFQLLAEQIGELVNMKELANTLNLTLPTVKKYIYILQKSFHIQLITPFYNNLRKELTKMPKVYFRDTWVRNALSWNFSDVEYRSDKWALLENIVFRELNWRTRFTQDVQFWRTQQRHEVDFVYKKQQAYECKRSKKKFVSSKYQLFQKTYPDISLEVVSRESLWDEIAQTM